MLALDEFDVAWHKFHGLPAEGPEGPPQPGQRIQHPQPLPEGIGLAGFLDGEAQVWFQKWWSREGVLKAESFLDMEFFRRGDNEWRRCPATQDGPSLKTDRCS